MLRKVSDAFVDVPVNTGRQLELDIAKGIAVISMVMCHVFMYLSDWSSHLLKVVLYDIMGGPLSAPIFMFCMGAGMVYSRQRTPEAHFRRGCRLLLYAYLLDFFRLLLPDLVYAGVTASAMNMEIIEGLFWVDILQFSGLFFIVYSLVERRNDSDRVLAVLAIGMSIAGTLLRRVSVGWIPADIVLNFFWRSTETSYFPLLNWFLYPAAGIIFARKLRCCVDKQRFYRTIIPVILPPGMIYLLYFLKLRTSDDLFYGMGTLDAIFSLSFVISVIAISALVLSKWKWVRICFVRLSSHVTSVYAAHWILVMYLYYINLLWQPDFVLPNVWVVPAGLLILLTAYGIAVSCKKVSSKKGNPHRTI